VQINEEFDFCGLFDRKISRLDTLENAIDIDWSAAIHLQIVRTVCNQRALARGDWECEYRSQPIFDRGRDDLPALCKVNGLG
jgi:hypothetical protein